MRIQKVVGEFHIQDPHVVPDLLVSNDPELCDCNRSTDLDLTEAPLGESVPNQIISSLADDAPNRVRVATEVPFHCFIAEGRYIEVAIATSRFHFHLKKKENKNVL